MSNRKAHTLIELCVAMSVGSALLVLTAGLLHQSLSLASTARARGDQHRTLDRLSHDFRHDVHLAAAVSTVDPQHLQLTQDDGTLVRYETLRDDPNRTRIRRQQSVEGTVIRQEEYPIDSSIEVAFESLEQPPRVAVQFDASSTITGPKRVPSRQITAVLGRRLAHQQAEVSP